eukprot:2444086-Rhodomonas_salina.1
MYEKIIKVDHSSSFSCVQRVSPVGEASGEVFKSFLKPGELHSSLFIVAVIWLANACVWSGRRTRGWGEWICWARGSSDDNRFQERVGAAGTRGPTQSHLLFLPARACFVLVLDAVDDKHARIEEALRAVGNALFELPHSQDAHTPAGRLMDTSHQARACIKAPRMHVPSAKKKNVQCPGENIAATHVSTCSWHVWRWRLVCPGA